MDRPITPIKVLEVVLNPDDELRNHQVALLYALTSERLRRKLDPTPGPPDEETDANWFTFAQWAVLTVGRNIRTDELPTRARDLPISIRRRITPTVLSVRAAADRQVAAALSFGQVQVLASVYRALLADPDLRDPVSTKPGPPPPMASQSASTDPLPNEIVNHVERLGLVPPDHGIKPTSSVVDDDFATEVLTAMAGHAGHQAEMDAAIELYRSAWDKAEHARAKNGSGGAPSTPAPHPARTIADLVFEANLRIAAIEQLILDDAVTLVLDHLPTHAADVVEHRMATFAERSLRVPRLLARANAARRLGVYTAAGRQAWARFMTDQVMVLALPTETVRLGRDMDPPRKQDSFYSPALRRGSLPSEAEHLFRTFDRSLGDGRGAGAGDWRRFDDRMNFVANLLRSRHQDRTLHYRPFNEEDSSLVWDGKYPRHGPDAFDQSVRAPGVPAGLGGFP